MKTQDWVETSVYFFDKDICPRFRLVEFSYLVNCYNMAMKVQALSPSGAR